MPTQDISKLYSTYLGRDGSKDSSGVNYWADQVKSGALTLDQAKHGISNSPEAQSFKSALPSRPETPQNWNTVQSMQNRYTDGQARSTGLLASQLPLPSTPYDGLNRNEDFLRAAYVNELGRDADEAGLAYWLNHMSEGWSRDDIIKGIGNAKETQGYRNPLSQEETPTQGATNWQNSPYSASMRNVNPDTDTMQGQLNDLLRTQNPLMQRAYYQGLDMANSRGLLNSSMASEAAQAAMMDKALPIAQNDAQTYYDQGTRNQGYTNQFNLNDRQYLQSAEQSNLDREHDLGKLDHQMNNSVELEHMRQQSGMYAHYLSGLTEIQKSDMSQEAKTTASNNLWDAIMRGSNMAGSLAKFTQNGGVGSAPLGPVGDTSTAPGASTPATSSPALSPVDETRYWNDPTYKDWVDANYPEDQRPAPKPTTGPGSYDLGDK